MRITSVPPMMAALLVATAMATEEFRTTWPAATCSAAHNVEEAPFPKHCKLAVVGAGWGGAYTAWRLAVDTSTIDAKDVCVFEANGRVGGRIYSLHGLPHFADLAVDVGGYRFQQTQRLPADLVWSALKMATACYDWKCAANCEGTTCYVIKDAYGNNAGYATVIERMLNQLEAAGGPGRQVWFSAKLAKVGAAPNVSASASTLVFADGQTVTADKVVLNMPGNAVEGLDPSPSRATHDAHFPQCALRARRAPLITPPHRARACRRSSTIFQARPVTAKLLGSVHTFPMNKVYAWYADAWWNTKLQLMEGYFDDKADNASKLVAPLEGRYHDGPQRCVIGKDTAGRPVYSGAKIQGGNCSGAIEVYYGRARPYYRAAMASPLQPLTVVTQADAAAERGGGGAGGAADGAKARLLADVHHSLMVKHAAKLTAAGVDPTTVPPPQTIVLSNWIEDGQFTPGIGSMLPATDAARKAVRKPLAQYELFVVNCDYGYQPGWAVGSLAMAEKVLQAEMGLPKPSWLDATWYQTNVVAHA